MVADTGNATYLEAVGLALDAEMERDPDVFLIGEDVGQFGGAFKVTKGFLDKFGPRRVVDTPIAETGFTGLAAGAALVGLRPVVEFVGTPGLAHVAYAEAVLAVDHFLGDNPVPVEYGGVPWVVYTHPEVAWSGMTEAEARAAGHDVVVHKHAFAGNGRAMILGETDGLVKVVAQRDGPILGFHLVGPWASELLHEGYLAVNWEALPAEVGRLIHAHPSLSEAIGETMITFSGRSLHG